MPHPAHPPRRARVVDAALVLAAFVWMLAFGVYFFSQTLPNNPEYRRADLLSQAHWILLDSVLPSHADAAGTRGWQFFPQRLDLIGTAAVILFGAWGWGHLTLRLLRVRPGESGAGRTAFAMGLGLSGLSLLTLGLGLCGLLLRPLVVGVLGAGVIGEFAARWRERARPAALANRAGPFWQREWFADSPLPPLVLLTVSPFVLAMLLGSLLPPTDFDVKEYHLQGPKEWFQSGRIEFLPHNVYTSFPFLTEMLPLLAMVLRGDWYRGALAGQAVLMSFAPLTAIGLFAAGRFVSLRAGWLAVLVFLTTPWIYRISIIAYAEGGLTFYLLATVLAVLTTLRERRLTGAASRGGLLLCGLMAGSAMACKYPGVLSVVIPAGVVLACSGWRAARVAASRTDSVRGALRHAAWFSVGVGVAFGPWAMKNLIETGNPVYPLLYTVFGGRDWDATMNARWLRAHSPPPDMFADLSQAARSLWAHAVDVAAKNDWQSALVFGAAPLALLAVRRRKTNAGGKAARAKTLPDAGGSPLSGDGDGARGPLGVGLALYAGWLLVTWWACTHRIDRFWVPMLPVVCLLAGLGLDAWLGRIQSLTAGVSRWVALPVTSLVLLPVMVAVTFNLMFITTPLAGHNGYLLDEQIARRQAMSYDMALLNARLPPAARVLLVGEAAVFDAPFDLRYNTVFDESLLEAWCAAEGASADGSRSLKPADEIRRPLRERGITHVFVNWLEILRYREPGSYGFSEFVTPRVFHELEKAGVLKSVRLRAEERLVLLRDLSPGKQQELQRWAPELQVVLEDVPAVVGYQLFEVE